jgi:hypothetical protein
MDAERLIGLEAWDVRVIIKVKRMRRVRTRMGVARTLRFIMDALCLERKSIARTLWTAALFFVAWTLRIAIIRLRIATIRL